MPKLRFTDLSIKSLPLGTYFDERTPSFGIRVGKLRKTWIVIKDQTRIKTRLGHYPNLSLSDARKGALTALGTPGLPGKIESPAFPDARTEYLTQDRWRPYTKYHVARILNRYFDWQKPLNQITHRDVIFALDAVRAPSERLHSYRNLRAFFNWCVPRYLQTSPMSGLKPPSRQVSRERVLSNDEIRRIWRATDPETPYGKLIRLLILLGTRRGETVAIQSHWLKHTVLTIPAAFTKNGREHHVPVPQMAIPLIQTMSLIKGFWRHKANLDKASVTDWTHHDLRRTYATNPQRLGIRLEVTEKLLNHVSGSQSGIVSVYQKYDFWPEMVEAVDRYEQFLHETLNLGA